MTVRFVCGVALSLALASCGGNRATGLGFSRTWRNDGGESIARLEQEQRTLPRAPNTAVAVGVTAKGLRGVALPDGNDAELEALMTKWREGRPYNPRRDLD